MSAPNELFDSLDAVSQSIDRGSLELASVHLKAHDAAVRSSFAQTPAANDDARRELLVRHRDLHIKIAALRDDAAQKIGELRRGRVACREYLGQP